MLSLHESSYSWGEGALRVGCRPRLAFPPSYPFELNGLDSWVILLVGLCYLIFGPYPSPQPPKHEAQRGEVVIVGVRPVLVIVGCNRPLAFLGLYRLPSYK